MTEPKIYTKNFVDGECVFSVSHGSALIENIFDFDKNSQWFSDGVSDDNAVEVSIVINFMSAGQSVQRTLNRIILINHNLKDPTFEYYDGSAWQTLVTGSSLASGTTIFIFTQRTTTAIRLRCSTTQSADEFKEIGELIATLLSFEPSYEMVNYDVTFNQRKSFELMLADGAIHKTTVMFSQNRSAKYEANVRFDFLATSELESLMAIRDAGQAFLWQPESTQRPDEVYLVNWVSAFKQQYISSYKGAGYRVDISLKEV